jgi:uncharacterized integral membrane protein (TIGR00697 family)
MPTQYKKNLVFIVLACFFVTNAITAELIGGKLIQLGPFTLSIGIIPWPLVFLTTDLINEFYGKDGVRRLSFITAGLIVYAFLILLIAMSVKAASFSPVSDEQFYAVFGQSMWIIVGSILAFLVGQLIDVLVYWFVHEKTGGKHIGLRATVSTAFSQLIDSFIVLGVAFYLPGKISLNQFINIGFTNYSFKLIIAIALVPLVYLGHRLIKSYLTDPKA